MTSKNIVIVIIIVAIAGAGWWYINNNKENMTGEENTTGTVASANHEISMNMMMHKESGGFSEPAITIKKGDSVTLKNMEDMTHTVTSDDGVFDSGDMTNGEMFTYTFDEVGEFPYHCIYHKMMGMVGKVIVQ